MKATFNGITVEGTPKELADYQITMDQLRRDGVYIKPPLGNKPEWLNSTNKPNQCGNNGCFCSGACMQPQATNLIGKLLNSLDSTYDKANEVHK